MKKALLVISFGTSYPEALSRNIAACEHALANAHPDRDCFRAFTSTMIINKLARRDELHIDTPARALLRLADNGYDDVLVQSLHIINGDEFEKVSFEVERFRSQFKNLQLGRPLLSSYDDYQQLISALDYQIPELKPEERVVFMGHGTTHHAFSVYACLDHMLSELRRPMLVGAVESYPHISTVIARLQRENVRKVYLMPLMLVAGDHAINDMASSDPDSWKTQLTEAGIAAEPLVVGLGENPVIQSMFARHLGAAIHASEEAA